MNNTDVDAAKRFIGKWKGAAAGNSERTIPRHSQRAPLTFGLLA